jgi:predicted permease
MPMQAVLQDFRYAVKQLRKNLGFSIVVILTLALSIGANTAIFSVVDALLLRPLPYPHPERLATLQMVLSNRPKSNEAHDIDSNTWRQLKQDVPAVDAAVTSSESGVNLEAGGRAQYVHEQRVSADYFQVLGMRPMLGRAFNAAEDTAGGPLSVVLSYGLWRNTFASNPGIIGQAIELKGVPYTVIGILPQGAQTLVKADLWTSLRPDTSQEGGGDNFQPLLRLKDGATWQQADAQLQQLQSMTSRIVADKYSATVFYQAVPLQQGLSSQQRLPALILMAAVGFVLLVACANLAGLALVRIGRRQSEIATRLALGATRWAILRQFWIESLLLTVLGVAAAILLGNLTLQLINQRIPSGFLPVGGVALDARVLVFVAGVGVVASLFFGLLPALSAGRIDVRSAMTATGSRSIAQSGSTRTRYALIVGEVALTVILLTVAGLLVRTLVYLRTLPPGFNPGNVVVARASLDDARYSSQGAFLKLLNESTAAIQAIPGVESAAVGLTVPYERALNYAVKLADGPRAGETDMTNLVYVTPGYFETLQIALHSGRLLNPGDTSATHPVAVVNETFARRYLGSQNSVGRHVMSDNIATEVVGIVGNVITPPGFSPGGPVISEPTMYIPATQMPTGTVNLVHVWFQPNWIVRYRGGMSGVTQRMQQALESVDPNLPVSGFYAMNDVLVESLVLQHMEVSLLSTLAGLALLLSAVGIYGLVSNLVNQRTRELGLRMALGCTLRGAMVEVSRSGVVATGSGLLAGLLMSLLAVKVLRSQLFGVGLYDPLTLCAVSLLLLGVAMLATILPACRITRIDPAETLRSE